MTGMTPYVIAMMLIGGLVVLGVLVGVGLILVASLRERRAGGPAGREASESTRQDHAA